MAKDLFNSLIAIVTAIIGLGIVATLVSRNAQSGQLIQNASVGLAQDLQAAEGPVSGFGGGNMQFNYASGVQ